MDNEKITNKENVTKDIKISDHIKILKKHFPSCFDKNGMFNLEKFKEEIKIDEINLSKESYDLEWLGKSYAKVLTFEPARTLLKENEEWNNKEENKNSGNILIKGDNLEVLKHLVNAYYEKIKMIYIDPPYNTGNDGFLYQDDRRFTVKELMELAGVDEERAKRILDFVNSKSNSHSAWLIFMYPRLYIARRLLREDGVIFVSIDDNEVAQLKILMDEIFGEENFVDLLIWRKKSGGGQDDIYFAKEHEYVICYRKTDNFRLFEEKYYTSEKDYPYEDEYGKYKLIKLEKWGAGAYRENAPSLYYPIQDPEGNDYYPKAPDGREGRWRKKPELVIAENMLEWRKTKKGWGWVPYEKIYYNPNEEKTKKERTILYDLTENTEGTNELREIFSIKDIFPNPKPTLLIKYLTKLSTLKNSIILDFFAGSGTTGDAVMQLNAEDGGNRKYILVQLPELIDPKKNKIAYDFVKNELGAEEPTIFDICKERLVRSAKKIKEEIINKKTEEKEKEIRELENKPNFDEKDEKIKQLKEEIESLKNQDLGFKIFETIPIWEDYLKDEKELTEETTLFKVNELTEDDLKALLLTWKTYDGMMLTEECKEVKLNNYTAYYCTENLYLLHSNWKTENIKALLEKIDTDKDFVVKKIIVFGYNFESRYLREIEENIRNYSNKKQIEIEVIIRF